MSWNDAIKDFNSFLRLEKGLSANSISAYNNDMLGSTQRHPFAVALFFSNPLNPFTREGKTC